jgi:hypothetical protein
MACFGFRPALTFFFSAPLDLRIYRTSALLFILFALGIFELGIYGIQIFSGVLVESYGTWLLLQRLDDASKDSDIPKNVRLQ